MISYEMYKIVHVVSIVLFFSMFAAASNKKAEKLELAMIGVSLGIILISGMGLVARMGIEHGSAWPIWLKLKLVILVVIAGSTHFVLIKHSRFARKYFWLAVGFLTLASFLANYKIH